MNALELVRIHLELECIGLDADGFMARISCANPDEIARFYIVQHSGRYASYFSRDLPQSVRKPIAALPPEMAFRDYELVKRILAADAPCESMHVGKSYVFPDTLTRLIIQMLFRLSVTTTSYIRLLLEMKLSQAVNLHGRISLRARHGSIQWRDFAGGDLPGR
jgi:hypothetical protein